jgi:cell division protease FtsH
VHKVSIVSRGMALGVTWTLPLEDKHSHSVADFKDEMAMALGGRTAEEVMFNEITTGAQNDLKQVNQIAHAMVTEYGMSPKLSNRVFDSSQGTPFLGRSFGEGKQYSEAIAAEIDAEVASLVEEATKTARKIITENKAQLEKIAKKLIEVETLEGKDFTKLFDPIDGKAPKKAPSVDTNKTKK